MTNQLKDMQDYAKKRQKGIGAFVNPNAGDVEKGNAMFNNATDVGSAPASGGMGESVEQRVYSTGSKVSLTNAPDKVYVKDFNELYYKLRELAEDKWNYRVSTYGDKHRIEIQKAVGAVNGSYGPVGGKWVTVKDIYSIEDNLTESRPTSPEYDNFDFNMSATLYGDKPFNYKGYTIKFHKGYNMFHNMRDYYEIYDSNRTLVAGKTDLDSAKKFIDSKQITESIDNSQQYLIRVKEGAQKVTGKVREFEDGFKIGIHKNGRHKYATDIRTGLLIIGTSAPLYRGGDPIYASDKDDELFKQAHDILTSLDRDYYNSHYTSISDEFELKESKVVKTINIREELNKRDMQSCKTDFVNMYESANLSEEKKMQLVKLLSENVSNKKLMEWFDEGDKVKKVYWTAHPSEDDILDSWETLESAIESCKRHGYNYVVSAIERDEDDNRDNWADDWNTEWENPDFKDVFTPEEQEEYGIDAEGNSINSYDTYHRCVWCEEPTPEARKELNMGWLCPYCEQELVSRGERPVFDDYGAFESLKESASKFETDQIKFIREFIDMWSRYYNRVLDKDVFEDALSAIRKAKTLNDAIEIAGVFSNLSHYRFKDTDEIVGHAGVRPAKTRKGNNSKTKVVYFSGDREYTDRQNEPAQYFDKSLAQPKLDKIFSSDIYKKDLKEEYGSYKDEPYCEEIADDLERESWYGSTANETEWNLEVDNSGYSDFDPYIADFLAREISYPVRDGHLSYRGLDCILTKDELSPTVDEDDLESIIPDLVRFGLSRKEIDKWLRNPDRDAEIEFYVDYDILFDVDEWEENNKEDIDLPTEVTYDFYTLVDDGIDIESGEYNLDDVIADRLSDDYGYCHFGFNYDINKESGDVYVYDIKWDLSEGLNESSQSQSKGLTEGDTFEYGGLSFTLWYLDGEDEFAIVCDDVEENYDNTPSAIGYVDVDANKNDVMEVIEYYFNEFMVTIGKSCHYSEHYLDNLGIKSSDEIVGKLRYAVEIQPETEMDEFENYEDALDYFNEMVDFYKNTEHVYDDELAVSLQVIDDETLYDTIKFWRKNPPEDEVLSESGNTTSSEDVDLSKFTNTNTNKEPLKQATFVIEDGPRFTGYDEEYSWNGWACPWFTKEEGLKIIDSFLKGYLTFDETKDAFVMVNQDTTDSEYDYYVGDDIETVDGTQHLYPIGNKSWIWDIVSDYEDIDDDMGDFYAVQN